jgi:hypothetical protein
VNNWSRHYKPKDIQIHENTTQLCKWIIISLSCIIILCTNTCALEKYREIILYIGTYIYNLAPVGEQKTLLD